MLWAAQVAAASCDVQREESWQGEHYRLLVEGSVGLGPVPCRTVVLASLNEVDITSMKASVRHWDDTRTVLRESRLTRREGEWIAALPELTAGDRFSIRIRGERGPRWDPETGVAQTLNRKVRWESERKPTFGPGGTVRATHQQTVRLAEPDGVAHVWFPEGSQEHRCEGDGRTRHHSLGCELRAGEGQALFTIGWISHSASSSFEFDLSEGEHLVLENVRAEVDGGVPALMDTGLRLTGPASGSVRITTVGGTEVPDNALEQVVHGSRVQSMPEPSIGLEFKGVEVSENELGTVLDLVRSQVHRAALPNSHPLKPRALMRVRKSGWATPYESALLLTRYLEQVGFKAEAIPVRPAGSGSVVAGAPLGFTGAVVRVETVEGVLWMDPSCAACAVGEVGPTLWSGVTFSERLRRMPDGPASHVEQEVHGSELIIRLIGPAATRLRQTIMDMPRDESRGRRIAELFGGPQATLVTLAGVSRLGEPIELRVKTQSRR